MDEVCYNVLTNEAIKKLWSSVYTFLSLIILLSIADSIFTRSVMI